MKLSLLKRPTPRITFTCRPEDEGVITPPVRAKTVLPEWFRKLPAVTEDKVSPTDSGLTRLAPDKNAAQIEGAMGKVADSLQRLPGVEVHFDQRTHAAPPSCFSGASITLRQYSYMPRISVSVTM